MQRTFVVGDVHGCLQKLVDLLRERGLIDGKRRWCGADARLWLLGDFVDRGPDGIGVIDLVRRWQRDAPSSGGAVGALLGNHDLMLLAAYTRGREQTSWGVTWRDIWRSAGGQPHDLRAMSGEHAAWLAALPAMALVADRLLIHADTVTYAQYGVTIAEVNAAIGRVLVEKQADQIEQLFDMICQRREFLPLRSGDLSGQTRARQMLERYGGRQIIHGHTPIRAILKRPADQIYEALVYADGLCVDVDGGMAYGGPGFVYEIMDDGE